MDYMDIVLTIIGLLLGVLLYMLPMLAEWTIKKDDARHTAMMEKLDELIRAASARR